MSDDVKSFSVRMGFYPERAVQRDNFDEETMLRLKHVFRKVVPDFEYNTADLLIDFFTVKKHSGNTLYVEGHHEILRQNQSFEIEILAEHHQNAKLYNVREVIKILFQKEAWVMAFDMVEFMIEKHKKIVDYQRYLKRQLQKSMKFLQK